MTLEIATLPKSCQIEGCQRPSYSTGKCSMHYNRFIKTGEVGSVEYLGTERGVPAAWILAHVDYPYDDCLKWPFSDDGHGYGAVRHKGKTDKAHRVMCAERHGAAPTKTHRALHTCKNGQNGCVNPNHLKWEALKTKEEKERAALTRRKAYYDKHSEKAKADAHKWQVDNRDRFNELHRECYRRNAETRRLAWRTSQLKYRQTNPLKYLVNLAASRSRNRGVEFSITHEDLVLPTHCPLLGVLLDLSSASYDNKPSIDRIDNTKGYVPGNVIVVSQRANRIKSDATALELTLMASNLTRIVEAARVNFGD